MFSLERRINVDNTRFIERRELIDGQLQSAILEKTESTNVRTVLTSIAIDVEHRWVGKALGAQRAIQLVEAVMPVQEVRYSVGDSPSDYDMADWLHDSEHNVTHLDVEHEPRTQDVAYTVIRENPANSQGLAEDDITGAIILWTVFAVLVVLFAGAWLLRKLASYCGNAVN